MKKLLTITLSLILALLFISGCTATDMVKTIEPETNLNSEAKPTLAPLAASATPEVRPTTYKESMLPFDQLVPGNRIVILQNTINYGREGFYTSETKPVPQDIDYADSTIPAFPMSYAIAFLNNGIEGNLKIVSNDGSKSEMTAEEFAGLFIIIDFTLDAPPVLYNPETGVELKDYSFAITSTGEAIYSVVSGSIHNTKELITKIGWNPDATYRYMATDKFYFPVGSAEVGTGEVRGTLSGAVNGSFPDLKIASGKINDLIYIESIEN